jgi:hypothetical protein
MAHVARTHRVRTFSIVMLLTLLSLFGSLGSRAFAAPTVNTGGSGGSTTIADLGSNLPPSSRADYHGEGASVAEAQDESVASLPPEIIFGQPS